MDRKKYWNESYLAYWRNRVAESEKTGEESRIVSGDAKTESDEIYERVFDECPFVPGEILDVGCAWGRMFGIFKKHNLKISGIDISDEMIEMAKKEWQGDSEVVKLAEAEAESLPFSDCQFDNLCCLAVFDATFQDRALAEFLRVLKPKGQLYLTGKNTRYWADDDLAFNAEVGARRKGHPNFFTDVASMVKQLTDHGHKIKSQYFFPRRGDFAKFNFVNAPQDNFYEYLIVLERGQTAGTFTPFSDQYSATFVSIDKDEAHSHDV